MALAAVALAALSHAASLKLHDWNNPSSHPLPILTLGCAPLCLSYPPHRRRPHARAHSSRPHIPTPPHVFTPGGMGSCASSTLRTAAGRTPWGTPFGNDCALRPATGPALTAPALCCAPPWGDPPEV